MAAPRLLEKFGLEPERLRLPGAAAFLLCGEDHLRGGLDEGMRFASSSEGNRNVWSDASVSRVRTTRLRAMDTTTVPGDPSPATPAARIGGKLRIAASCLSAALCAASCGIGGQTRDLTLSPPTASNPDFATIRFERDFSIK